MKGVKNPIGSNILAVRLRTERFVSGSDLPYFANSVRSKKNSSERVSQFSPKTLTVESFFTSEFPIVVDDFAYDSSSSVHVVIGAGLACSSEVSINCES